MSYELKKDASGQYRFNLKAGNGEIILNSEAYPAKATAEAGIASVAPTAPTRRTTSAKTPPAASPTSF